MTIKSASGLEELIELSKRSSDFKSHRLSITDPPLYMNYYSTLIDDNRLQQLFSTVLQSPDSASNIRELSDLRSIFPIDDIEITDCFDVIQSKLFKGYAIIRWDENTDTCALIPLVSDKGIRKSNETENEFSVLGPKIGFVEDLDTNIHLIRMQLNSPNLIVKELTILSF
ncbi:spore germination protein [Paenibacillus sp. 2TAB23]|uniref:spore germination protein n=1 Tax=Paenibacillus sp. 2TAB23 TaxID=3233004 RepID=UPI003F990CA8